MCSYKPIAIKLRPIPPALSTCQSLLCSASGCHIARRAIEATTIIPHKKKPNLCRSIARKFHRRLLTMHAIQRNEGHRLIRCAGSEIITCNRSPKLEITVSMRLAKNRPKKNKYDNHAEENRELFSAWLL